MLKINKTKWNTHYLEMRKAHLPGFQEVLHLILAPIWSRHWKSLDSFQEFWNLEGPFKEKLEEIILSNFFLRMSW